MHKTVRLTDLREYEYKFLDLQTNLEYMSFQEICDIFDENTTREDGTHVIWTGDLPIKLNRVGFRPKSLSYYIFTGDMVPRGYRLKSLCGHRGCIKVDHIKLIEVPD